jgi:hypothetical protein
VDTVAQVLALLEAAWAPAMSPMATRPSTLLAKTVAGMPVGQHNKIETIAQPRWLGMCGTDPGLAG